MNKKYIFLPLITLLITGCTSNKGKNTIIEFNLSGIAGKTLFISNGNHFRYDHKFNSKDSSINFIDTLNIEETGYSNLSLNRQGLEFYLEEGSRLKISANASDLTNTIEFEGDLANENDYLVSKQKLIRKNLPELFELPVEDFITGLKQYEKNLLSSLKDNNTSRKFMEQEIKEIKYEITTNKLRYSGDHLRITGNEVSELPSGFYADLNITNFTDTMAFINSQTNNYPFMVISYFEKLAKDNKTQYNNDLLLAFLKEVDNALPKGSVKDELLLRKLQRGMRLNDNMDEVYKTYMGAFQNEKYLKMATLEYEHLKKMESGKPAPNFDLENYLGGHTQLEDLKGQYIYIDIWATWCRPCIAEFPELKKIANKFPEIQFVSISIDRKKDFEKWQNMVDKENLPGIQLIAYQENETFKNDYAIRTIPRYVLIDKNGAIVSASAFHPSNPKLFELFKNFIVCP